MAAEKIVQIPDGVTAELDGMTLRVTGPKGTLSRDMKYTNINLTCNGNEFVVSSDSSRKSIFAMVGTYASHARNMCTGVTDGYVYQMKVVYNHFPIQLKLKSNSLEIVNFLGEKQSRFADIIDGVDVKLESDEVTVSGIDKEAVGTTAARIECATKVKNRDQRVFQDGIYIVNKA